MYKVTCNLNNHLKEIVPALAMDNGFDGSEETKTSCILYATMQHTIENHLEDKIAELAAEYGFTFTSEFVKKQNWNAKWETGFEPIEIDSFCRVRAPFHPAKTGFDHELIIQPKMSFGTGHHATTALMIKMMQHLSFTGKKVLDFGCGTGILSVLASKMGAENIDAIDHEEWAFKNSIENMKLNTCLNIKPYLGTLNELSDKKFEIVLANINRNVLLSGIPLLKNMVGPEGFLLMSGFLENDLQDIETIALQNSFRLLKSKSQEEWYCQLYKRV
jgi:ribosomal protein L11 methyltransferase